MHKRASVGEIECVWVVKEDRLTVLALHNVATL